MLNKKIEYLLLKLGFRPEQKGVCAGYFYTVMQAFLSGELENYLKRLHLIICQTDLRNNYVGMLPGLKINKDDLLFEIKKIQRSIRSNQSVDVADAEKVADILGYLDAIMISQKPRHFNHLFGREVKQNEILVNAEFLASKRLSETGGIKEFRSNKIPISADKLDKQLTALHAILSDSPVDIVIRFFGAGRSANHVNGICYDAKAHCWFLIDINNDKFDPITDVNTLVKQISNYIKIYEDDFVFYTVQKNEAQAKRLFETFESVMLKENNAAIQNDQPYLKNTGLLNIEDGAQLRDILKQLKNNKSSQTLNQKPSLFIAAAAGLVDLVEEYAKEGKDLNQRYGRWNLAQIAAFYDQANIIDVLGKYNVDLNKESPISFASCWFDLIKAFVKYNVNVNVILYFWSNIGLPTTPLENAVRLNDFACIKLLIEEGKADPNFTEGQSAILIAAENGFTNIVEYLAEKGANVNASQGRAMNATRPQTTAVYEAVKYGHTDSFEVLARYGANLEQSVGMLEDSPLSLAIERAEIDILQIMANHNVDFSQVLPRNHLTPLEFAKKCDFNHIVEFIENILSKKSNKVTPSFI